MQSLAGIVWLLIAGAGVAVGCAAVVDWLRDRAGAQEDEIEPDPANGVAMLSMLVCAGAGVVAKSFARSSVSFRDIAFSAVFIAFAVSAGRYLLVRRNRSLTGRSQPATVVLVSLVFGVATGFGPA